MLIEALESTADPISDVFDEIMRGIQLSTAIKNMNINDNIMQDAARATSFASTLKFDEKAIFARLKELAFNLDPLRAELKGDKNLARKLTPYLEIYTKWQIFEGESGHDVDLLNELLDKIQSPKLHNIINESICKYAKAA
jgi:hypothetical protein